MNEEYERGKQIGEIVGELSAIKEMLERHIIKQDEITNAMEKRLTIAEQWIQTTTGKVIILTAVFGIIGSIVYIFINWLIRKF